ncbi:MAG: hypothetical protein K0Q73_6433 [Paenibacillus sp.]|nr:hypothetical protein [Paenibacillus sp.]
MSTIIRSRLNCGNEITFVYVQTFPSGNIYINRADSPLRNAVGVKPVSALKLALLSSLGLDESVYLSKAILSNNQSNFTNPPHR